MGSIVGWFTEEVESSVPSFITCCFSFCAIYFIIIITRYNFSLPSIEERACIIPTIEWFLVFDAIIEEITCKDSFGLIRGQAYLACFVEKLLAVLHIIDLLFCGHIRPMRYIILQFTFP